MKTRIVLSLLGLWLSTQLASAQGTAFTYQGRLTSGTNAANGRYDLRFGLFDTGGTPFGPLLTNSPVSISNGFFTVALDFGANFPGTDRWLEIGVRTNGSGTFIILTPRQKLTPAPYAITAGSLTGVVPNGSLSGTYGNAVTFNNLANSFTGSGAGLNNLNASQLTSGTVPSAALNNTWKVGGNAGANPTNGASVGTTDNLPLELKVNNSRALRLEPGTNGTPNIIGGSGRNTVSSGVIGATIAGGGTSNYFGFSRTNRVTGDFGTVSGGFDNGSGKVATVGGGYGNSASAEASTVSGGANNTSQGLFATIGGGYLNWANGYAGAVPGGQGNHADGVNSFAAGRNALALHDGAFVWADNTPGLSLASTRSNQFLIRASSGVGIGTASPGKLLQVGDPDIESEGMMRLASRSNSAVRIWDIGVPKADENGLGYSFVIDDTGRPEPEFIIKWNTGNVGIGTANPTTTLDVNGTVTANNLAASGNAAFRNMPGVSYSQSDGGAGTHFQNAQSITVDSITMNVPASGFVFVSAFIHVEGFNNAHQDFKLLQGNSVLVTSTSESRFTQAHLSWVIPVSAGSLPLQTQIFLNQDGAGNQGANFYAHNLTAIFLPAQY